MKWGQLEVLQWARANGCPWDVLSICEYAAKGGHLEVLQWARDNGCPWNKQECINRANYEFINIVEWINKN